MAGVKAAVAALQARGPRRVLVTSLRTPETPASHIDMLAAEGGQFFRLLRAPLLPISVNGAGDAVAALFLVHTIRGQSAAGALSAAGSAIFGILRRTAELRPAGDRAHRGTGGACLALTVFQPVPV